VRILGVIPARYGSTRFPGKPLVLVAGKPLLQHVIERCKLADDLHDIVVATDDVRIARFAEALCTVVLTRPDHPSGTDRIAEVAERMIADAYVNIQGDEPLICPTVIQAVACRLSTAAMSTAATPIREVSELNNPNCVKVVLDASDHALYFSRHPIPYLRDAPNLSPEVALARFAYLKHLGIYGYTRSTLQRLVTLPVSSLEQAERLEQLRALQHGIRIAVARVDHEAVGVDVPDDVPRVEALLARKSN